MCAGARWKFHPSPLSKKTWSCSTGALPEDGAPSDWIVSDIDQNLSSSRWNKEHYRDAAGPCIEKHSDSNYKSLWAYLKRNMLQWHYRPPCCFMLQMYRQRSIKLMGAWVNARTTVSHIRQKRQNERDIATGVRQDTVLALTRNRPNTTCTRARSSLITVSSNIQTRDGISNPMTMKIGTRMAHDHPI